MRGIKALPSSTGSYLVQKIPFVRWLPNYTLKWLVDDMIAGVSVALVLIPQALASAAFAGIPLQSGLFASWLPSAIYFFMGTSKGNTHPIHTRLFSAKSCRYLDGAYDVFKSSYQCSCVVHYRARSSHTTSSCRVRSLVLDRCNVSILWASKPRVAFKFCVGSHVSWIPNVSWIDRHSRTDPFDSGGVRCGPEFHSTGTTNPSKYQNYAATLFSCWCSINSDHYLTEAYG